MKIIVDRNSFDYIEVKGDGRGSVDLSIRAKSDKSSSVVITAKMSPDILDKVIANLILLKSRSLNEKE